MTLPPEILDKILESIPTDTKGRQTLAACALVATWWTGPSQRRLFSSIIICESNYERCMANVVPDGSKTRPLGYVRSLAYSHQWNFRLQDLVQDCGEYFSALRNLHSLAFHNIRVEHSGGGGFPARFSAFRETLTHLSLSTFTMSFSAFVTLVGYFPNLTALSLNWFVLESDEGPVPSLSQPLRGKLRIHEVEPDCLEFFNRFAKLDLEYEELLLDSSHMSTLLMERVLRISPRTVKFLRLVRGLHRE